MLELNGEEAFEYAPEILWQYLSRPAFLCQCFPNVDRIVRTDDRSATVIVRPGFSFVRGTLEVSFEFTDSKSTDSLRVLIHVKGIGSSAELETGIEIAAVAGGSHVKWATSASQIGGLLKAVSRGLIQAAAQKVASDTWNAIRERLRLEIQR